MRWTLSHILLLPPPSCPPPPPPPSLSLSLSLSLSFFLSLSLSLSPSLSSLPLQKVRAAQRGRPLNFRQPFRAHSFWCELCAQHAKQATSITVSWLPNESLDILLLAIPLAIPDNAPPSFPGRAPGCLKRQSSGSCSCTSAIIAHARPDRVKLMFGVDLKVF